ADEIVALPGQRDDLQAAYVLVGESLVQQADVMIAIWDGQQARGPGGTGHVVALALEQSVPVIHVEVSHETDEIRVRALLGDGHEPHSASLHDSELYSRVLRGAFKLGPAPQEQKESEAAASD
ncbi:MAG TPA: hypothetical protein VE820_04845, partial [Sphingomicrobium sp.]|nr:hypothetical protein [Sphingomicrobium sp.]